MTANAKAIVKSLKLKFIVRAARTFDRATTVVVCVCWGASLCMLGFTLYTVSLSASTRRAAETAAASEPILPKIVRKPIDAHDAQPLMERLEHRYPTINFSLGSDQSLSVSSTEGAKFKDWLTVLSYIDVISPKYRWTIKDLCVGQCGSNALMRAVLTGQRISFEVPQSAEAH